MDGSPPTSPKRRRHQRDDMYEFQKYIGRGGFAMVELWKKRWDDEALVVAKRISLAEMTAEEEEKTRAESLFLKSLRHPHIVRYSGSWVNKETEDLMIIQEYCSGGDLAQFIKDTIPKKQLIASDKVLRWLAQLTHALLYCHKDRKILHRDLKPSNVFLVEGGNDIRLGDFGVATILSSTQSLCGTVIGTQVYMSPEILRMQKYGLKTDVWGLGVIMYELCTLRRPFDMTDPIAAIRSIVASEGPPPFARVPGGGSAYPAEVEALCFAMLNKDTDDRPTLSQLLVEHKCLRTVVLDVERRIDWKESLVPVPSDPLGRIEEEQFSESSPVCIEEGDDEDEEKQVEQESRVAAEASTPSTVEKYKDQSEYDMVLEAFHRFDLNGDGKIDCEELGDVLAGLDSEMWNSSAIQELFKSIDLNSNERIEWEEWIKWVFESERGRSYRDKLKTDAETMKKASSPSTLHTSKAPSDSGQQRDAPAKKGGLSKFAEESRARLLGGSSIAAGSGAASRSERNHEKPPAASPVEAAVERSGDRVADVRRAPSSPRSALIEAAEISDMRELALRQKELRTLLSSVPEYAPRTAEDDLETIEDEHEEDACFQQLDMGERPHTSVPPGMPPADMAARPHTSVPPGMPPADLAARPMASACAAGLAPPGMPPLQRAVTAPVPQAEKDNSSRWTCPACDEPNKNRTHCNNCGAARPEEECVSPSNWTCPICDEPNKNRKQCNNCGAPSPSSRTTAPRSDIDSGTDSRSLSPAVLRPTQSSEHQQCEPAGVTFNTETEQLTRKVAVIDARLRCIEALQARGDPDPVELNHTLRQARELELGREDCGKAILAHTTRLCIKAEDTIAKPDATLPVIEHSAELLETVQTEAQVPEQVVDRANERLQRAQEAEKQLGLRCACGPIVRRVSVRREEILSKVKAQIARRWGRPDDALVLQFRQGGALFSLDTEAQWQDCVRVHPKGPVEVVVNMPKKVPLAKAARQKKSLQSMAARSKAVPKAGFSKTAPAGRMGRGGANASSLPAARGVRR